MGGAKYALSAVGVWAGLTIHSLTDEGANSITEAVVPNSEVFETLDA